MLEIKSVEEGGGGIYGAAVAGGVIFCMSSMDQLNTAFHTW